MARSSSPTSPAHPSGPPPNPQADAFGRKRACPSTWISFITTSALVREGLATISVSGCGSWLRLTPRGRYYARVLAEAAEGENSHPLVQVTREGSAGTV